MQANYVQRIRLKFGKEGPARFISHLDLARALERALNRSRLPVAYTQGYNPRPRVQFASALALGFTSSCELADVWLEEEVDVAAAQSKLAAVMPPGLPLYDIWEAPLSAAAMQATIVESTYKVDASELIDADTLQERVKALLGAEELVRERRGKKYNLRPLILGLSVEAGSEGPRLAIRLSQLPGKTGRPDEVLLELGLDPLDVRVQRTAIVLQEEEEEEAA
jgi:radical SAM-linked protein